MTAGRPRKAPDLEILDCFSTPKTMLEAANSMGLTRRSLYLKVRELINQGQIKTTINKRDMRRPVYFTVEQEIPV